MSTSVSAYSFVKLGKEKLDTVNERSRLTVCVVGCGRKGLTHACLFADAGFKVIAADKSPKTVSMIKSSRRIFYNKKLNETLKKHVKEKRINITTDVKKAAAESDVITIFAPVDVDEKGRIDYSCLEKTCKEVGLGMRKGSLVINMTTVTPGTTEELVRKTLENASGFKAGEDFGLGYASPINSPRIAAGINEKSLKATATVLRTITNGSLVTLENVKAAETAFLFTVVQRGVDVALASEFSVFCEKVGVDYLEVQKAVNMHSNSLVLPRVSQLSSKPFQYVLEEAEALNLKMRITSSARENVENVLAHAVRLVRNALRACGKPLRRSRIAVLGVSAKPDRKEKNNNWFVKKFVETLAAKGARIKVYDPFFTEKELNEMGYQAGKTLTQTLENVDCIVVTVPHERFRKMNMRRLSFMVKMPAAIVDLAYILDREKAEKEGFAFRGLGRG